MKKLRENSKLTTACAHYRILYKNLVLTRDDGEKKPKEREFVFQSSLSREVVKQDIRRVRSLLRAKFIGWTICELNPDRKNSMD